MRTCLSREFAAWLNNGANLLLFGPPGGGKSHLAAALGFALVENGWRVLFTRTTDLVQRLWALGEMRWPTMGEARLDVGKSGAFSRFSGQPAGPTPAAARTTRFTGQPRKVHQIVTRGR